MRQQRGRQRRFEAETQQPVKSPYLVRLREFPLSIFFSLLSEERYDNKASPLMGRWSDVQATLGAKVLRWKSDNWQIKSMWTNVIIIPLGKSLSIGLSFQSGKFVPNDWNFSIESEAFDFSVYNCSQRINLVA
jgi:hypothetical protein